VFEENPLGDFVELPDDGRAQNELWYSNLLCGVLRGALEMVRSGQGYRTRRDSLTVIGGIKVQMQVDAHFVSDILRGNETTEMRVSLVRYIDDELPQSED